MASNSYEDMQNENRALRAENEVLKKRLDEAQAHLSKLELENGDLKEENDAFKFRIARLNAQMEVVYLIFGGRR